MKVASFVLLIAVIVQQSNAVPEDLTKFLNECKEAEKVTDADVMNFKNRIKPATKEVKCLTTCIIEKIGLISNNQLSKDGVLKFIKSLSVPMPSFEKVLQDVSQAVDGCKTIQDPDSKLSAKGIAAHVKTLPINSDKVQESVKEILEECKGGQDPDRQLRFGDGSLFHIGLRKLQKVSPRKALCELFPDVNSL
ncbi:General odorant-binding protein 56h [Pseudolycoriella hygida]|uniref:General odorant-binding protein 56h n=1 Tax=Pseudolycoriella hygida TaxID=35572 RepID=A0A9Q0RX67_9DIPT|nr:General odorant-binding protein 56h [Pseudolycoriella hygida]